METFLSHYGEMVIPDDCVHGVWLDRACPDCTEETELGGNDEFRLVAIVVGINNYKLPLEEADNGEA